MDEEACMSEGVAAWYAGRRVFVTGHTGFKGAWLTAWLRSVGAEVTGFALAPDGTPNLFDAANVAHGIESTIADIRDLAALETALGTGRPEIVFHLAAQSLVRRSYRDPVGTYETNVMGTAHVLDVVRRTPSVRAVVIVTSDKCYENRDLDRGYVEDDPMGGHDAYSSSKGCAELVTSAFRRSFFHEGRVAVASARAGNVIGGGDWAEDRLVPDLARAAAAGVTAVVRNPTAVRPWQFVLEPLRGYLTLGRALVERGSAVAEAWNFGPDETDAVPVGEVVQRLAERWDRVSFTVPTRATGPHEARLLKLDCSKAHRRLAWQPVLTLNETLEMTMSWYRDYYSDPRSAPLLVQQQLKAYAAMVERAGGPR